MAHRNQSTQLTVEVKYIDFGYTSAKDYFLEVVLSAYDRFREKPNRQNAIDASLHAWHVHYWIWHDLHQGKDTRNEEYNKQFLEETLFANCPSLRLIATLANAAKHRAPVNPRCGA
jgi:hypothetical protein